MHASGKEKEQTSKQARASQTASGWANIRSVKINCATFRRAQYFATLKCTCRYKLGCLLSFHYVECDDK